jgi:hypothetical protein
VFSKGYNKQWQARPQQVPQSGAPIIQNGCYFNLPPAPANLKNFNPDLNGNNCVEQNEYGTYIQLLQNASAATPPVQSAVATAPAPSPVASALVGAVVGSAMQGGGAPSVPLTGKAAGWVASQNAIGAVGNAIHGNTPIVGAAALPGTTNPGDTNGDGILTAQEIADHQARMAASVGVGGVAGQAVGNATAGAVGGMLKGLFGR